MPGEDVVPPGPQRQLLLEIHRLYRMAGCPSVRDISTAIKSRDDLKATLNRNLISRILNGKQQATAPQLDSLVRHLAGISVSDPDPDFESQRIISLWLDSQELPHEIEKPWNSDSPLEKALYEASSQGSADPVIKLCANADPRISLEALDALAGHGWKTFEESVRQSFAETYKVSNLPTLIAQLRPHSRENGWDVERLIRRIGQVRSTPDLVELVRLFISSGREGDAVTVIDAFFESRTHREIAVLYRDLHAIDIQAWDISDGWNRASLAESAEEIIDLVRELQYVGFPEGIAPVALHRTKESFAFEEKILMNRIELAMEMEKFNLKDIALEVLTESMREAGDARVLRLLSDENTSQEIQAFVNSRSQGAKPCKRQQ
jgi:hypothetical protein